MFGDFLKSLVFNQVGPPEAAFSLLGSHPADVSNMSLILTLWGIGEQYSFIFGTG